MPAKKAAAKATHGLRQPELLEFEPKKAATKPAKAAPVKEAKAKAAPVKAEKAAPVKEVKAKAAPVKAEKAAPAKEVTAKAKAAPVKAAAKAEIAPIVEVQEVAKPVDVKAPAPYVTPEPRRHIPANPKLPVHSFPEAFLRDWLKGRRFWNNAEWLELMTTLERNGNAWWVSTQERRDQLGIFLESQRDKH